LLRRMPLLNSSCKYISSMFNSCSVPSASYKKITTINTI
jgi:hypothetical protein